MKLFFKNTNLDDQDTSASHPGGQTDGHTDGQLALAIPL